MKKIFSLFVLLFFSGASLNAAAPTNPCSKFDGPSPQGNWLNQLCSISFSGINPLDMSNCATLTDNAGGSFFVNSTDFVNLGVNHRRKCLCFDYNVGNDGVSGSSVPIHPSIYLSFGGQHIWFQANVTITEGSKWVHICAPIAPSSGGVLPSNADGQWMMPAGYTATDFDNVMNNSANVFFIVDVAGSSAQTEVISVDNVCVVDCEQQSEPLPCATFNNKTPGNWQPVLSSLSYGTNPLDNSACATLDDGSGGSYFRNAVDYNNLASRFLHKCLCFDYNVSDDGVSGSSVPINPSIYLAWNGLHIWFQASATVTEGSQWVHVCAPIELSSGGVLPSNADGQWMMPPGYTTTDFDNVISNCTEVFFIVDVAGSSAIAETISVDNICVVDCASPIKCNSGFRLETSANTSPVAYPVPPSYMANVFLNFNNPGSTYTVDWGDGAITSPFVSHIYAGPGSYIVCVTEYQERRPVCKTCMSFCFGVSYDVWPGGGNGEGEGDTGLDGRGRQANPGTSGLDILKNFQESDFSIFPNPSKDVAELALNLSQKDKVSIRVIDLMGKTVVRIPERVYETGNQTVKIATENLLSGVYHVEITAGGKVSTLKLSVIK